MNRDGFLDYIGHFNNKRYDALTGYFAPDITVEYYTDWKNPQAAARTLQGRQAFVDAYSALHEYVREVLELGDFLASDNLMAAELYTEFHCIKDHPAFSVRPLKKGDVVIMTNWAIYTMEDEKMRRIRIAHCRMHDPQSARHLEAI